MLHFVLYNLIEKPVCSNRNGQQNEKVKALNSENSAFPKVFCGDDLRPNSFFLYATCQFEVRNWLNVPVHMLATFFLSSCLNSSSNSIFHSNCRKANHLFDFSALSSWFICGFFAKFFVQFYFYRKFWFSNGKLIAAGFFFFFWFSGSSGTTTISKPAGQ